MFPVTTHRRAKSRAQGRLQDPTMCGQLRVRQQALEKGGHHLPLGTGPFQGPHGDTAHLGVCLSDFSGLLSLGVNSPLCSALQRSCALLGSPWGEHFI